MFKARPTLPTIFIALLATTACNAEEINTNKVNKTPQVNNEFKSKATPMEKLTLKLKGISDNSFTVSEKLFGEQNLGQLIIENTNSDQENSAKTIVTKEENPSSESPEDNKLTLVVLASLNEGKGEADILQFKQTEKPYIDKFKGNITHSIVLDSKKTGWDLLEVVEFDNKASFFEMMGAPAYQDGGEIYNLSGSTFSPKTSAFIVK